MLCWHRLRLLAILLAVHMLILSMSALAEPGWLQDVVKSSGTISAHKDARSINLYHQEILVIGKDGRATTHVRVAVKLLKSSGKDDIAFSEGVYAWREVRGLEGWMITPDGKVKSLDDKQVVKVATGTSAGFYDDMMAMVATFPDAPVGAIVAYEYYVKESEIWGASYQTFVFQEQQPVAWAQFVLELPEGWAFHSTMRLLDTVQYVQKDNRHEWTVTNLPFRTEEPLMLPWWALARRIAVSCYGPENASRASTDWASAARFVAGIQDSLVAPDEKIKTFAKERFGALTTRGEQLRAIAEFVGKEVRYVAVEIGKGRFVPRPPSLTLANRFGDCKDKVACMRSLLAAVGIPSVAALTSVETWVAGDLPSPFQFDHVIVAIPADSLKDISGLELATVNGWVFYDPTDHTTPFGWLPVGLSYAWVLVAAPVDSPLVRIPALDPDQYSRQYSASAVLTPYGGMEADVRITDQGGWGYATAEQFRILETTKELERVKELFGGTLIQPVISGYATGTDHDSAWMSFHLSTAAYVQAAGDFNLLKLDFFHEDEGAVLKSKTREHPIYFGPPLKVTTEVEWKLPDSWQVDGSVENAQESCSVASVTCIAHRSDSGLAFSSRYECAGKVIEAKKYSEAQAFRRTYEKIRGLRAVLRKKQG